MKEPVYTISNDTITIVIDGKPHTVRRGAPNFTSLDSAIRAKQWDEVPKYLTVASSLKNWSQGKFIVNGNAVTYDGTSLPSELNDRIIAMASAGEDPSFLFKFWERLQKNPSWRSVQQLYPFLKHQSIPITKDGCFLAYKSVRPDYKDHHSGTVSNKPGTVNQMPRNKISDDPNEACHEGFHVGAMGYVRTFGGGDSKILVCKVAPEDVVCVPYDSSQQKMRVCRYLVLGHYGSDLPDTIFDDEVSKNAGNAGYERYEDHVDKKAAGEEDADYPGYDPEEDPLSDENLEPEKEEADAASSPVADAGEPSKEPKKKDDKPFKVPREYQKYQKMDATALLKESLDTLRKYATYGLRIVGASKIPNGKSALVGRILKVRE